MSNPSVPGGPPEMARHIAAFSRLLRSSGIATHPSAVMDACRAASAVGLQTRDRFYWALRANFVTDRRQHPAFDRAFRLFWDEGLSLGDPPPPQPLPTVPVPLLTPGEEGEGGDERRATRSASKGASPDELLVRKDLRALAPEEEPRLQQVLQTLLSKLFTRPSRRARAASRGRSIEFRRSFRKSIRFDGEVLELVRRECKLARRKIALLGDVSGSMDVYGRFFLQAAHAIARMEARTEVYAFSTRLFRLTEAVRQPDVSAALDRLTAETAGWSGGTRIGECLREFNDALAREAHLRRTVVVIFSDGWDRGDPALLRRELARLKGGSARIYWLNPLKGDPDYRPICRGMATALPYLDGFYAAHNVESLARFARLLARVR
jgi:uncharacterized protein